MDGEELGGTFYVSVDELGLTGLWTTVKDVSDLRACMQCSAHETQL
jgi:hypothetical protein